MLGKEKNKIRGILLWGLADYKKLMLKWLDLDWIIKMVWARVNLNSEAVLLHVVQYLNACERLNYSNGRYARNWREYQVYIAVSPQITLAWIFQHRLYDSTRKSNLECILNVRDRFFAVRSRLITLNFWEIEIPPIQGSFPFSQMRN